MPLSGRLSNRWKLRITFALAGTLLLAVCGAGIAMLFSIDTLAERQREEHREAILAKDLLGMLH